MDTKKKKIIIALSIIIGLSVIAIIIAFIIKTTQPQPPTQEATTSVDPVSGETVINGPSTGLDSPNAQPNQPTYLGFARLVDRGLSIQQVDIIESALTSYSLNNKFIFKQVSLDKDTIERVMQTSVDAPSALTFTIVVNTNDSYFVRAQYTDPSNMMIKLYKADKTTLLFTQ